MQGNDHPDKDDLARELLQLDNQLAQAVKQCKGLLRARPPLSAITETFNGSDKSQISESAETP